MLKKYLSFCLLASLCLAVRPDDALTAENAPPQEEAAQTLSQWIENLPSPQQGAARNILDDVRPRARELRCRIEKKMKELEQFSYARGVEPDTLPRLGRELQELRDALMCLIKETRQRMRDEAGITVEMPRTRSYGRVLTPAPFEGHQPAATVPETSDPSADSAPDVTQQP